MTLEDVMRARREASERMIGMAETLEEAGDADPIGEYASAYFARATNLRVRALCLRSGVFGSDPEPGTGAERNA